jgi:hypothetical protein
MFPVRNAEEATQRLNRLLAEFRLYGGFGAREGMKLWGEIQRMVREIDRLREPAEAAESAELHIA